MSRTDVDFDTALEPRRPATRREARHAGPSHRRQRQRQQRQRQRPRRDFKGLIAVVLAFLLLGGLVGGIYLGGRALVGDMFQGAADYPGPGSGEVVVVVEPGDTATAIGRRLQEAGVVASTEAFADAAKDDPRSTSIQPGSYRLRSAMSGAAALALMLDPASVIRDRVVIPEGKRLSDQLELLSAGSQIPVDQFQAALQNATALGLPAWANGNPEGFLFPATYDVDPATTAESLVTDAFARFQQAATTLDLEGRATDMGKTPYEIVTIASLVQAEGHEGDFGKIARTIYNRLAAGQRLEIDATVNYALNKSELGLTPQDLEVASPYNTYVNVGLPPTPINAPGEAALEAALSPEPGDWLYWITVDPATGETRFTSNYDEFLRWKQEYKANS